MFLPILWNVSQTEFDSPSYGGMSDVLPIEQDGASGYGRESREPIEQLRLSVAIDSGDSHYLTLMDIDRKVLHLKMAT